MIRKFIFILAIIPMLANNMAAANYAVDQTPLISVENNTADKVSETFEKPEGKEKFSIALHYFKREKFLSGHLLIDLYAVPPERFDLPYEPPIA